MMSELRKLKYLKELCGSAIFALGFFVAYVGLVAAARAQQPVSATGTGMVTGHVTCGDTQRPARFATVVLYGVPAQVTAAPKPNPDADQAAQMKAITSAFDSIGKTNMVATETGDGAFVANDVAPGDYYVFGAAAGYIAPLNQVEAAFDAGADMKKSLPGVPIVHVTADNQSTMDVTLDRGAAISGTISWDDGSPVTGAIVTVTPVKGAEKPPQQFSMLAMANMLNGLLTASDDLGHFRISSLAPGDYILQTSLKTGGQTGIGTSMDLGKMMAVTPLVVYAPAAFHKADAKPITLHAGEDVSDVQVTLNLSGMHSVSGRVSSAEDQHGINSATVTLEDASDKDFKRSTSVDAAGNFTVTLVPPGTYTMKVSDAEDTVPDDKKDKSKGMFSFKSDKTVRSYVGGKQSVIVTDSDVTGQNIALAVDKNPQAAPDFNKLFSGDDSSSSTAAPK